MLPLENDSQLSTLNGWLELAFVPVGTDEKIWERRFFKKIDFDIEYYEEAKNGSLVPVGTIEVSTITSIEPDKSNPRIFYINTTNQYKESRTYELCAPNENMAKHWIESLRDWKAFIDKYQEIVSGDQRLYREEEDKLREKRIEEAERKKREKKEFRAQREKERQLREQLESETNPSTQPSSTQFVQRRSPSSPGETPILIPSISPETPHHQDSPVVNKVITRRKSMLSQETRAQLKKDKILKRKNEVIELQQRLLRVQKEIELETKNESELKQKLQSINLENTDSLGFIEFVELVNILDGKKRLRSEVNKKILRCEQLYQEAKIAGKKAKERTKFHQENTISIAENVRKLNEQKSQLSYLVKEKLDRIASLKLLLDDHKTGRITYGKDIKEISEELKDQIAREDVANASVLLQQEILIYEKKKMTTLSASEFQNTHYEVVMKEFMRQRQKLWNIRKVYVTPPDEVVPMREILESLKYLYFKSLALGVKLNSLCFDPSAVIDSTLIIEDFYEEIKKEKFHWKFWPQILGDKLSKNFDIEEAKLKFIMEEKKNEESENDKTKNENLRLSNLRKSNIFKSNNDDDIILCLPSVFHEKKYHLKHYNARNRNTINDNTNNLSNNNNLLNNNTNNNTLISHNFSPSKSKPNFEVETKNNRLSINETMTIPRGIQHREAMGQTINEPSPTVRWLVKKTDSPNQDLIVSESYQHHFL